MKIMYIIIELSNYINVRHNCDFFTIMILVLVMMVIILVFYYLIVFPRAWNGHGLYDKTHAFNDNYGVIM